MDTKASFGEVLKELRNRKRLSRPKLALRLKVHPSSIEKWERGDVLPDRARVDELVRALALSDAERLLLLEAHAGRRLLPSLHNLPAVRNPYFTGRDEILAQLHQRIAPGSQVALTQAISGLGGIGKTQVALEYVYRYQKKHSHLFWVLADSAEMLTREFCRIARDLDLPEKDENDQGKIVRAVQRWLREYLDWVMILDNIEDLGLVGAFIPPGHLGAVVLTTRRQVTEPVAQTLVLDVLSEDEGMLFLLKRSRRLAVHGSLEEATAEELACARAITQQLGGLPLALDQAGAYIAEVGCDLSDYLALLTREQHALLQRRGSVPTDHPQSVTLTFSLAFEQVQRNNEVAIELLKLCSLLAPDAIPLELFTQGARHLGSTLEPIGTSTLSLDQALEALQSYSLVRRDAESKTLSLHRLIQAVLRETMTKQERTLWRERAIHALHAIFPDVEHTVWRQCERLTPHVLECAATHDEKAAPTEQAEILMKAADYLRARAQYRQAELLYQQAIGIREQLLGPEHPQVALLLNKLASTCYEQGRYEQAEPLHLRALHLLEQAYGSEHPELAYPLNNLANLYRAQGKDEQAEPLYLRAVPLLERAYGADHPRVTYPLNNLADLYQKQGRDEQAEPLLQRVLRIREQTLGPEHPDVAYPLHNLGILYQEQGKDEQAEQLFWRVLHVLEPLGPEHPLLAHPLTRLGMLYREQGQYERAERLFRRALQIRECQLGVNHLDTAETQYEFARLRHAQGNVTDAEALFLRALTAYERWLGRDDPRTQATMRSYAAVLRAVGKIDEAAVLETRFATQHF